jgi:alkanesulfonate monooxygenase SsuD/methylene tetrahydromethanopterin reductase-like flavin-dependent oxidoreductase (luciferase family)
VIAVGVQTWGTDVRALRRYWTCADELGYARITYGDGLWAWTHDGFTLLGVLAADTRRARIGPAVTYAFDAAAHHPSWLAKRAVAMDHVSDGRLDLRLAVGARDAATAAEWQRHGIAYPDAAERVRRLEEAVTAMRALWAGETVETTARGFRLAGARLGPPPVQRPGPPVWIAAMRAQALALTARVADGWEASFVTPPVLAAISARLDAQLAHAARPPAALRRSVELDAIVVGSPRERDAWLERFRTARALPAGHPFLESVVAGEPEAVAERVRAYAAAGATDLMLGFADFPETGMLERFAREVMPALRTLSPVPRRGP